MWEKKEPSYTGGMNADWSKYYGELCDDPQNTLYDPVISQDTKTLI